MLKMYNFWLTCTYYIIWIWAVEHCTNLVKAKWWNGEWQVYDNRIERKDHTASAKSPHHCATIDNVTSQNEHAQWYIDKDPWQMACQELTLYAGARAADVCACGRGSAEIRGRPAKQKACFIVRADPQTKTTGFCRVFTCWLLLVINVKKKLTSLKLRVRTTW